MYRSSVTVIAVLTLSGAAFAQTDISSAIRPAPPTTFAGTYHVATGIFTPGDQDPGLGTGNEIYNNTADSGFFFDQTGIVGSSDEGVIPNSALIAGAQDEYVLTSIEIAYFTEDATLDVEIDLYDDYVPCADFTLLGPPVATIVAPGLPGGGGAGMGAAFTVILDVTSLGICLRGSDGVAPGLGYVYRFPTHVLVTGPLLASDPDNCPPGDGTFYQNPIGGCDGAGAGSGLGDEDSVFLPGFGCSFFGGYPTEPFASWHFAIESELAGGCCSIDEPSEARLNEIYASHAGTDDMEFIELVGPPGASLDAHAVLIVEGDSSNPGTLDRVWDLSGLSIPASGYFVLGDTAVSPNDYDLGASNTIENGTETFYLVQSCDIAGLTALIGTDIDPDGDLITLIPTLATIVDIIAMVDGGFGSGDLVYDGAATVGPDGTFLPAGIFRGGDYPSGWCDSFLDFDDVANLDLPRTPGAANGVCPLPCTDDCACAVPIFDGLTPFSTLGATTDGPADANCQFDGQTYNDTWFIYEATCTGNLEVSTCNTVDYDTDLVVYDGTDCNNLTTLGCNDDFTGCAGFSSIVNVPVVSGNSYLIRVGGFNDGDVGSGDLSLICTGGVSNDDCADRTAISGTGVFDFDNTAASTDGAPDALCDEFGTSQIDNDVWFTWTAPCNGDFVVETCDLTTVDTKIAIYDGADCATSAVLDCNDDTCGLRSQVTGTGLIAGQSYLIRIGTFPGSAGGTGQFRITGPDVGGVNYCEGGLNGDGQTGAMGMSGSASVAANDLVVVASSLADASFAGLFVMGDTPDMFPFASGFLCIDLGGTFIRLHPIVNVGGDVISRAVDNTAAPSDVITPGSTWYFQYWYRDVAGFGTNLTDGICICFAP